MLSTSSCCTCRLFIFIVKLFKLLFLVSFATGYIHSGEIKIFRNTIIAVEITRSKNTGGGGHDRTVDGWAREGGLEASGPGMNGHRYRPDTVGRQRSIALRSRLRKRSLNGDCGG